MWIKARDSKLINLKQIESIELVQNSGVDAGMAIVAVAPGQQLKTGENYVIFTGSPSDCEITLAEIEAGIVGKIDFLEL